MIDTVNSVAMGAVAMASTVAALFFLRFWRQTGDIFFLLFSLAFAIDACSRVALGLSHVTSEEEPFFYLARLVTYGLIIAAIVHKNRPAKRRR
jgi:hypothetical protein